MNAHLYSILSLCVWEYLHLLCCDLELNDALLLWNHFKGMVGPRVWQSLYIQDNWTASGTNILIRTPSFWNNLKDYKDLKYKAGKACSWAIWMWQCALVTALSFNMEIAPAWKATQYGDIRSNSTSTAGFSLLTAVPTSSEET